MQDHVVIVGWREGAIELVQDLYSQRKRYAIVVTHDRDRVFEASTSLTPETLVFWKGTFDELLENANARQGK